MSRPLDQAPRGRAAITRPASAHNFVAIVLVQWMTAANRALRTMLAENETSAPCRARRAPVTAMPVAATVVVTSAVPVAAAVAYCQRPGAAAVADCLCSSGSGGDACGGEGGGDSGGACGCGYGKLQIAGEVAAVGCGGGDAAWRKHNARPYPQPCCNRTRSMDDGGERGPKHTARPYPHQCCNRTRSTDDSGERGLKHNARPYPRQCCNRTRSVDDGGERGLKHNARSYPHQCCNRTRSVDDSGERGLKQKHGRIHTSVATISAGFREEHGRIGDSDANARISTPVLQPFPLGTAENGAIWADTTYIRIIKDTALSPECELG